MILGADQLITLRMRHRVPPLVTLRLTAGDWPSDAKPSFLSLSVDADFMLTPSEAVELATHLITVVETIAEVTSRSPTKFGH